jgi:lon-related putative ATP-dependent protease
MVLQTPSGLAFAPTRQDQVLPPEEFQKLPPEEQKAIEQNISTLQEAMQAALEELPRWQKEMRSQVRALNKEVTAFAAGGLITDLRNNYADYSAVIDYLSALENDVIENARRFLEETESAQQEEGGSPSLDLSRPGRGQGLTRRYQVNLLIDHSQSTTAPVIYEDNPTVQNLIGRVEHMAQLGALVTDFNLIKPGCLHKANGGYLILDARKIIGQPLGWESLKRALRSGSIQIESAGQIMGLTSTISLEPEPIPLKLKVALLGDRELYFLLTQFDPDFDELFKVAADFDEHMEHTSDILQKYAQLIGTLARRNNLRPLHKTAVARVIEHSGRMIGDSERLSAMMNTIADLLREADYWASEAEAEIVKDDHVQQAIDAKIYRLDRMRSRMQEMVVRETILIDTTGEAVGQINGLSVLAMGDLAFGKPSRITARVRLGKGEVIDIEREVELGGALHSKGVLILSSFLGSRYAPDFPLSLSASLVFEQSYGGVDGDSASSTELYALLSAISEVPLKQSLAVTGSVNQHGQVQAIGGVNEKIEGFFDLCNTRGLTGDQGVLIPQANTKHLMLRRDVVDAVAAGQFHIYPVATIDQGIELLTGQPAGEPDESGNYPQASINGRVQKRLKELAARQRSLADDSNGKDLA